MLFSHQFSWSFLYVVDVCAIVLFFVSYYRNCYSKGYSIDIWHYQLILSCILTKMIMLAFAKSELNVIVLGTDMDAVVAVLPTVFLIAFVGYVALIAGGATWRLRAGLGLRKSAAQFLGFVPRCSMMLMSSRGALVFQSGLCASIQLLILALYFTKAGFGFDLRRFTFENPTLRPLVLVASGYSVVIASHCFARYADTKEKILLACTLLLSFGLVFFGARSSLAAIYINVLLCYLIKLRDKISLLRIAAIITFVIAFAFYLGNARAGDYSVAGFIGSFVFLLFYGNNFSDLRDFAWVYSSWTHVCWGGKTYLAAILSFIPRFASQFRD